MDLILCLCCYFIVSMLEIFDYLNQDIDMVLDETSERFVQILPLVSVAHMRDYSTNLCKSRIVIYCLRVCVYCDDNSLML